MAGRQGFQDDVFVCGFSLLVANCLAFYQLARNAIRVRLCTSAAFFGFRQLDVTRNDTGCERLRSSTRLTLSENFSSYALRRLSRPTD